MRMTGAEIVIKLLERQGLSTIAGIPGGANLPLYDALNASDRIRHVLARHEQGAGFIAQGIARTTGEPAVCFATSGPGATNLLTALADAKLDSVPIICVTGQVPLAMIGTDAFQEVDTFGVSMPISKHNYLIKSAFELLTIIPEAFSIAQSGRPGPVLIDIPKDVQLAEVEFDGFPEQGEPIAVPSIVDAEIARMADMIDAARTPILYLGGGVVNVGAGRAATAFAEKADIPVVTTLMGLGAIPKRHPLNLGMLGMHGDPHTNLALDHCDLLIVAGARFDDRATGKLECFCPDARVIHIDIDDCELNKLREADMDVHADVGDVFPRLAARIQPKKRGSWRERIHELMARHGSSPEPMDMSTPIGLIEKTAEILGDETIIATDVGQHQMWVARHYPFQRERQFLTSGGLGTMGFGVPAAIGAALARPDRPVVCFSGDGSVLMNIQELATAVEENVNVKIIVMNNHSLGLVRQQQSFFYGGRHFASTYKRRHDFVKLAEGFGMPATCVASAGEEGFRNALLSSGPALIHAPIDVHGNVLPMVPPGAANRDMIIEADSTNELELPA